MRIDLNFGNIDSVETNAARRVNEGRKETNRTGRQDDATLSAGDSGIARLSASAIAAPEIRMERVTELRNSIQNGTYTVEPGAIADAILKDLF